MAKKALALVRNGSKQQTEASIPHYFRERPVSEEWLFQGKDELGREGWFLRIEVTGLYPRRCGPFTTQAKACAFLESVLGNEMLDIICNIQNEMSNGPKQACVVEGVARLVATPNGAGGSR